jgi:hypothetical protein
MWYESVLNAWSRNAIEQVPFVGEPNSQCASKRRAPGAALPVAIAICPRGIVSVRMTAPVAGSQSQYPTWSWNVSGLFGRRMCVW